MSLFFVPFGVTIFRSNLTKNLYEGNFAEISLTYSFMLLYIRPLNGGMYTQFVYLSKCV